MIQNEADGPLSEVALKRLVELKGGSFEKVRTHEGVQREFKETFNYGSLPKYLKTMASFANAKGGYLIFGVTDSPRHLKGLSEESSTRFDDLDRAKLSEALNEHFSPEIGWDSGTFKLSGRTLGVIYVFESETKPVIVKKTFNIGNKSVQEGDVLYRYNSRSEKIKFPELSRIMTESRERESRLLLGQFETLLEAGASNAAILDLSKGVVQGPNGQNVLLDAELIDKISFIKEGEFVEKAGAPALKLVGDVQPANTVAVTTNKVNLSFITTEQIIEHFLRQDATESPENFIRALANGTIAYLPIHFFRVSAGWSVDHTINEIQQEKAQHVAKDKLISRLESADDLRISEPSPASTHRSSKAKRKYLSGLRAADESLVGVPTVESARWLLEAMHPLSDEEICERFDYLCRVIVDCFNTFYTMDKPFTNTLRRACCRLDLAKYRLM